MDSKKAEALRKKYWEGKTSQKEEVELKKLAEKVYETSDLEDQFFSFLSAKANEKPLDHTFDKELLTLISRKSKQAKLKNIGIKYWYIAASLALIISVSIIISKRIFNDNFPEPVVQADTYEDPELAFEETKKALLFISSKLNQGNEYTSQFSKFEQSQEILKQN